MPKCSMGSGAKVRRDRSVWDTTGAVTHCGPLWKQSNALVIKGTKNNKAGGGGSIEMIGGYFRWEVSMSFL